MSSSAMNPLTRLWYRWKSLKLPWRRRYLVGADLAGNTFWEFKDAINAKRLRRIVQYHPRTHYSDIKITPQWHQWLRQTRHDPPSIREQQADVARQARLKHLAVLADERWASKPSLLDRPNIQSGLGTVPRDPAGYAGQTELEEKEGVRSAVRTPGEIGQGKGGKEDNPWKRQRGGPSEEFQPAAWSQGPAKR